MNTGTLLGVWAHPDDEAYLSAGLMAAARRHGHRVVVVTATAGEHGTAHPDVWPPARLAAHRRDELEASLAALGVVEHLVLGHADGGCHLVDGTGTIAELIDDIRPDTIVTFGPDGMTGHADHRAVSSWATAAWRSVASSARLWYATLTPAFHRRWHHLNERIGLWADIDQPPCTERAELAHVVELDGAALDQKLAALYAHHSQTAPLVGLVGPEVYREWWRTEAFIEAAPQPAHPHLIGAAL